MKQLLYASTITVLLATGCGSLNAAKQPSGLPLRYHNAQYDFTFNLPASWQGYSVLIQQWDAPLSSPGWQAEVGRERGPIIIIRNPQWEKDDPYQDIPIVVFTRSQWAAEQQQYFCPYAGGLMDEICHNRKYVFGIGNRALGFYDQPKGWSEARGNVSRNMGGARASKCQS